MRENGCQYAHSTYDEQFASEEERENYRALHPKEEHSEFTAGKVNVQLTHPITLQMGFYENPEWDGAETEEAFPESFSILLFGPENGTPMLTPVKQPGPSLTESVDTELLPPSELRHYKTLVNRGLTKTYAVVELASEQTDPSRAYLNLGNLLEENNLEALGLPVKVHLISPFLGKNCYVGSDENPIQIKFTSGKSGTLQGKLGRLEFNTEGTVLTVANDTIVDGEYSTPGVENCGAEGEADAAVDAGLGLPSASGNTSVIDGSIRQTGSSAVKEVLERYGTF